MHPILAPLVGMRLLDITKQDYSWSFQFESDDIVMSECAWRLVSPKGIVVSSEDHGHQFGLPESVDARDAVYVAVRGRRVIGLTVADLTSDLSLFLEGDLRIDFLVLSSGYESWHAWTSVGELVCQGGGDKAEVKTERQG